MTAEMRICKACKWVHFPMTPWQVLDSVWRFLDYYRTLTAEKQQMFYGGRPSYVTDHMRCFRCGGSHLNFRVAKKSEIPFGSTIQPIMYEGD